MVNDNGVDVDSILYIHSDKHIDHMVAKANSRKVLSFRGFAFLRRSLNFVYNLCYVYQTTVYSG